MTTQYDHAAAATMIRQRLDDISSQMDDAIDAHNFHAMPSRRDDAAQSRHHAEIVTLAAAGRRAMAQAHALGIALPPGPRRPAPEPVIIRPPIPVPGTSSVSVSQMTQFITPSKGLRQ